MIAGVDEVGRGPLAGPVVACALILHETSLDVPIDDSKRLSPAARETAYRGLLPRADIGIGFAGAEEIDRIGIHNASLLAMRRAVNRLPILPALILVDGSFVPRGCSVKTVPIVGGDAKSLSIAGASIVAKVIRDRMMIWLHRILPHYGFHRHKGYGTPQHLEALRQIGATDFHRFSFRPVRGERCHFDEPFDFAQDRLREEKSRF
ncbi:MAG: ribonuclease HII [Candidatus Omnitrophica bacterium]|nr:ribonuclease HII [Candidatus Omnitrophota bacterium]